MRVIVTHGDILDEAADVLICSANVHLNLSGGVGGAILARGGDEIQRALHESLRRTGRSWVEPGTVVGTGPGPLRVGHILHAVAIDGFYGSSVDLLRRTIERALAEAARLGARSVALPSLATGYGPLSPGDFAEALRAALAHLDVPIEELRVVLRHEDEARAVAAALEGM